MRKGIYQDDKGKWYISTKINGKQFTKRGFASKREADLNYDYEIEKWKRLNQVCVNDNSYEIVRDNYLEYIKGKTTAPRPTDEAKTQFNTYFNKIFSNNTLSSIFNIKRLEIIYKDIKESNEFSVGKKHYLVKVFRDFAFYCYQHKYFSSEMWRDVDILFQPIKLSRCREKEKRVISQDEIKAFLGVINKDHRHFPMFSVFVACGLRIGEFLGICVDVYDREKQTLTIKRQFTHHGELTNHLKTANSYRTIYIPKKLCDLLNEYIDNNRLKGNERIFKISKANFDKYLHIYEDMAGIPNYSPHEFRHTVATNLAKKCENYGDVVACANYLGHSVSMFSDTYCHFRQRDMKEIIDKLV